MKKILLICLYLSLQLQAKPIDTRSLLMPSHNFEITKLKFSKDNTQLISTDISGEQRVWQLDNNYSIQITTPDPTFQKNYIKYKMQKNAHILDDNTHVILVNDENVKILEIRSEKEIFKFDEGYSSFKYLASLDNYVFYMKPSKSDDSRRDIVALDLKTLEHKTIFPGLPRLLTYDYRVMYPIGGNNIVLTFYDVGEKETQMLTMLYNSQTGKVVASDIMKERYYGDPRVPDSMTSPENNFYLVWYNSQYVLFDLRNTSVLSTDEKFSDLLLSKKYLCIDWYRNDTECLNLLTNTSIDAKDMIEENKDHKENVLFKKCDKDNSCSYQTYDNVFESYDGYDRLINYGSKLNIKQIFPSFFIGEKTILDQSYQRIGISPTELPVAQNAVLSDDKKFLAIADYNNQISIWNVSMEMKKLMQSSKNEWPSADVNALNSARFTRLAGAVYNDDQKMIRFLLDAGADPDIIEDSSTGKTTALGLAASNGKTKAAQMLLEHGAKFENLDTPWQPIHWAAARGHLDIVKLLIAYGADKNVKNNNGQTPISLAMSHGRIDVFNFLNSTVVQQVVVQKVVQQPIDTTAPKITILEPSSDRGLKRKELYSSKTILVKGKVEDDSKITKASINNKSITFDAEGHFEVSVNLSKGTNNFTVAAEDKHGNRATKTITLDVAGFKDHSLVSKLQWYTKQHALIIGINQYKNPQIPALNNAVHDAKKLEEIFTTQGFHVTALYNEQATKSAILKAMKHIRKTAKQNDNFIFYFAGHGQGFKLSTNDKVGYILPDDSDVDLSSEDVLDYDTSAIALNDIRKYAKAMPTKHIALLLDSCFSGLAMKRSLPKSVKYNVEYYNDILARKSINILTAGDDQPVSDGSGHSPFTTAIIEAMEKKGVDVNDRDGLATFNELASYIKAKVEKATNRRQRPQFDNLSHEDGDFIFMLERK